MTYNVLMGTLNPTHSLTQDLWVAQSIGITINVLAKTRHIFPIVGVYDVFCVIRLDIIASATNSIGGCSNDRPLHGCP